MSLEIFIILLFALPIAVLPFYLIKRSRLAQRKAEIEADLEAGKASEALLRLRGLVLENPDDLDSLLTLATLELEAGNSVECLQCAKGLLLKTTLLTPDTQYRARVLAARASQALGNLQEARAFLLQARAEAPESREASHLLLALEYERGAFQDAFALAGALLAEAPEDREALFHRGMAALRLQQREAAAEALERLCQLDPGNFPARLQMGKIHESAGRGEEAIGLYGQALAVAADGAEQAQARLARGMLWLERGEPVAARTDLEEGLQLAKDPDLRRAFLRELISLYETGKDVSKTLWAIKDYLRLEPGYAPLVAKLAHYQELDANTRLQTYEMIDNDAFTDFCKRIAVAIGGVDGFQDVAARADRSVSLVGLKTRKQGLQKTHFLFLRSGGEIGELLVRELYAKMRAGNGEKAILVSNGSFSEEALQFAETRMVSLVDKNRLLGLLASLPGG